MIILHKFTLYQITKRYMGTSVDTIQEDKSKSNIENLNNLRKH